MNDNFKHPDLAKIQAIALALGLEIKNIEFLGQGATSAAWRVDGGSGSFVVRIIPAETNRPVTYLSETAILHTLLSRGLPVPTPIANSLEHAFQLSTGEAWTVTRVVDGRAVKSDRLTRPILQSLGNFLAVVHGLPIQKYGRLEESRALVGQQKTQIEGIKARWCWANIWPFDDTDLSTYPLPAKIISAIEGLREKVEVVCTTPPAVLNHSDLHGEHIFIEDNKLTGIIDFGAAFMGVKEWDFAVFAFYHGWDALDVVLDSYDTSQKAEIFTNVKLVFLVLTLYKLNKKMGVATPQGQIDKLKQHVFNSVASILNDKFI